MDETRPEAGVGEELLRGEAEDLLDLRADVAPAPVSRPARRRRRSPAGGRPGGRSSSSPAPRSVEERAELVTRPVVFTALRHRVLIDNETRHLTGCLKGSSALHPIALRVTGRVGRRSKRPAQAQPRALGDDPVEAREGERADQAAVGLVGGVELFDLGDRGAAAEVREVADQLDVAEVAGGQRVGFAAAEEGEALDRPGADFGDREEAGVATRARRRRSGRGRPSIASLRSATERPPERSIDCSSAGARPAISAAGGTSRSAPRPSPRRAPQRPTMRRSIVAARLASISCPQTAAASASQGQGRRLRAEVGQPADDRPDQRVAAEALVEGGHVLVDAEREAHPLDRRRQLLAPRRPQLARRGPATVSRAGSTASARKATRPGPAQPGAHQDRRAVDGAAGAWRSRARPAGCGRSAAADPERRGRPDLDLERRGRVPTGASGRAGGRRPGRSGWRSPCRGGGGGRAGARPFPREPTAETRADRGDGRRAGQHPAGDGDRGASHLAAQHRRAAPRAPDREACGPGRRRPRRRRLPRRRSPRQGGGRSPNPR